VLYAAFFAWYTSFGGPLTSQEISSFVERLDRVDPALREKLVAFMRSDTGDDFAMLNAIDLRDEPLAVPGVEPGVTSEEMLRRYSRPFLSRAILTASHPIFLGSAAAPALDVWGIEGAERWDSGGLVRYRSRRDFMEQVVHTQGADIHGFKRAAMEKTIAYPVDPFFQAGDPRLLLALLLAVACLLVQWRAERRSRAVG
jgi:hypothetical protein